MTRAAGPAALIRGFRLYGKLMSMQWQAAAEYRLNWMLSTLCTVAPLVAIVIFWRAVFRETGELHGYTLAALVTYYVLVAYLNDFMVSFWYEMAANIRDGTLSGFLIRPISYLWYYFALTFAVNSLYSLFSLGIFGVFVLVAAPDLFLLPATWADAALFLAAVGGALVLAYLLMFIRTAAAFWIEDVTGLGKLEDVLTAFVVGSLVPLDFLPTWLSGLIAWLPWPYLMWFPAELYLGRLEPAGVIRGFTVMALWAALLGLALLVLWRRGLRRYTASGG